MVANIAGPAAPAQDIAQAEVTISTRRKISGGWTARDDIEWQRLELHSGAQGIDTMAFFRRYGRVREPFENASTDRRVESLEGTWVRVDVDGTQLFVGMIHRAEQEIHGVDPTPSGEQQYLAMGGGWMLRRVSFSGANVVEPGGLIAQEIGWLPPINRQSRNENVIGNRTAAQFEAPSGKSSFIYGNELAWTHKDYIEYLLAWFMSVRGGPIWTLGGQTEYLDTLSDPITLPMSTTVEQVLLQLISVNAGLDYYVKPKVNGFEVTVFALTDKEFEFADESIPKNNNVVTLNVSERADTRAKVSLDTSQLYDGIRIVGNRYVCCFSVEGFKRSREYIDEEGEAWWTEAAENAYKDGTGDSGDDEIIQDTERQANEAKFSTVYQRFRVGKEFDWIADGVVPKLDLEGNIIDGEFLTIRRLQPRTMRRLPLRQNVKYDDESVSENSGRPEDLNTLEQDNQEPGRQAELLRPFALLNAQTPDLSQYIHADRAGYHGIMQQLDWQIPAIHVLSEDFGMLIDSLPNHLLAKNHFNPDDADTQGTTHDPTDNDFDYEEIKMTIAVEADARLTVGADRSDSQKFGDNSILIIPMEGEFWWLAPDTIVAVEDALLLRSPDTGITLRSDADKMRKMMPGLIARYLTPRARARVTIRRLMDWGQHLGKIVKNVIQGQRSAEVHAPITTIIYTQRGKQTSTTLLAGHAMG